MLKKIKKKEKKVVEKKNLRSKIQNLGERIKVGSRSS